MLAAFCLFSCNLAYPSSKQSPSTSSPASIRHLLVSRMDPLSAFSHACGVIQVVDFSMEIVSISKEIYDNGSLKANDEMEDMAKRMREFHVDLEPPSSRTGSATTSAKPPTELQDLARKCQETSEELLAEFQKLKSTRKRDILRKIPATINRRKVLDSLEDKLDSYRKILNTHILVHLRSDLEQSSQATAHFSTENRLSYDRLAQISRDGTQSVTHHVTRLFLEMEQKAANVRHNEELLGSLHFPETIADRKKLRMYTGKHSIGYLMITEQGYPNDQISLTGLRRVPGYTGSKARPGQANQR